MRIKKSATILLTFGSLISLYLGLADISLKNDKLIHFITFLIMTILFRNCIEDRNILKLRYITFTVCTLIAGIGSEFFQSFIASYRSFDVIDIVMNVSGSLVGNLINEIYIWYTSRRRSLMRLELIKSIGNEADSFVQESSSTLNSSSDLQYAALKKTNSIEDEEEIEDIPVPVYIEEKEKRKHRSMKKDSNGRKSISRERVDLEKGIELKNVLPVPLNEQRL